jgi:hypothetical protein
MPIDVEKLALEAGFKKSTYGLNDVAGMYAYNMQIIDRFAALVLEAAALKCEDEHVGQSVNDDCDNNGDRAYNLALRHASVAIRAMKPGESHE